MKTKNKEEIPYIIWDGGSDESLEEEDIDIQNDMIAIEWEDLLYDLQELINKINHDGHWRVTVNDFGWRNQSGYKYFSTTNASYFLRNILPDTDCHFKIFKRGKKSMKIVNYHHDSPMGETYIVAPSTAKKVEEFENNF